MGVEELPRLENECAQSVLRDDDATFHLPPMVATEKPSSVLHHGFKRDVSGGVYTVSGYECVVD